jgi:hypothetical protein
MCKLPDGVMNSEVDDLKERGRANTFTKLCNMLAGRGTSTSLMTVPPRTPRNHIHPAPVPGGKVFILVGGAQRPRCCKGSG